MMDATPHSARDERWSSSTFNGLHPLLPWDQLRASTFCDLDLTSELLEYLALASNTFYSSHVALLIPFSKFFKRDHYTLSVGLGSARREKLSPYTIDIMKTLTYNDPESTFIFYFAFDYLLLVFVGMQCKESTAVL